MFAFLLDLVYYLSKINLILKHLLYHNNYISPTTQII